MIDVVNRPAHYNKGRVECIDAIEVATSDLSGIEAVCTANAIKSSVPFFCFHRHKYLIAFAVHTASIPLKSLVATSIASMHSTRPLL